MVRAAAQAAEQGRREHTRSPSPTHRELTRLGEVAAADVFENEQSPLVPIPSAVAREADRAARHNSYQYDDSRLQSPAGNATGMRSPDVVNPDPIHPDMLRNELNRQFNDGTDMPDTNSPRPYSAQIAALSADGSVEPSSARLQQALSNASPDIGAEDVPSHQDSPDLYGAELAYMNTSDSRSISRSVSRSVSRPASARVHDRQWQTMSPQYEQDTPENETGMPNWGATNWDELPQSPPLPVVSPGLDDNNDSTPTTPGEDQSPPRSPVRSTSVSPVQSPGQGVPLSHTDSFDNGYIQESRTPGSDFVPTRPVSQLDLPTLSDMTSDSPAVWAAPDQSVPDSAVSVADRQPTEPSSAVSVGYRQSTEPSSAVAISSPEMPRRSFEPVVDTTDEDTRSASRRVATETTPGENQAALQSLWSRAESRQSSRMPMSRNTSRAPSFEEPSNEDTPPNREANTESWYNPTVRPRLPSPSPTEETAPEQSQPSTVEPAKAENADPYVDSLVQSEQPARSPSPDPKRALSPTGEPSFESMQSQTEVPTADPVADAFMSQAESEAEPDMADSATSPAAEAPVMSEMGTSPMAEKPAMVEMATSPMEDNPHMSRSLVASPRNEPATPAAYAPSPAEEKPAMVEMATSPMVENPRMSKAATDKSDGERSTTAEAVQDPIADALLSQVPAGEQHEDVDTNGFVGAAVKVPPTQLAKKTAPDAEYDPYRYSGDDEAQAENKSDVKQVDEKTLGNLVGMSKPTPVLATPKAESLSTRPASTYYSAAQTPNTSRSSHSRATSPSESGFQTGLQTPVEDESPSAQTPTAESPLRTVSQLNLPTISAVTAERKEKSTAPTPKVANVEVLSPVSSPNKSGRSDSHDSKHGSLLSDMSSPSTASRDSQSHEEDESGPKTPDEETSASPFTPGLKELFGAETPRVSGELNSSAAGEKLRRPPPPARTASQLAYADED